MTSGYPSILYVIVTDACNFSCDHCYHSSSPEAAGCKISHQELLLLSELINKSSWIEEVHFTGGEPTLDLQALSFFQSQITRPVKFGITTNCWFGKTNPALLFESVKIDRLVISFDKFHAKYIDVESVNKVIAQAKQRAIHVKLNSVVQNIDDLASIQGILIDGIEVAYGSVIYTGRAKETLSTADANYSAFASVKKEQCPSLGGNNRLTKLYYYPGRGFTFCCGSLLNDKTLPDSQFFTKVHSDLDALGILNILKEGSFEQIFKNRDMDLDCARFGSVCDLCSAFFEIPSKSNNMSICNIAEQAKQNRAIAIREVFTPEQTALLTHRFSLKYTFKGCFDTSVIDDKAGLPGNILVTEEYPSGEVLEEFLERHYFAPYKDLSKDEKEANSRKALLEAMPSFNHKRFYYQQNKLVAVFATLVFDPHPLLKEKTFHIGHWGYDRSSIDKSAAKAIKNDWFKRIRDDNRDNLPVTAAIYSYVVPSQSLASKIGLKPVYVFLRDLD